MKINHLLFLFTLLFTFLDCSKDVPEEVDKIEISAIIQCKVDGVNVPDIGACLYLFKDFTDYVNYDYESGTYVNKKTGDKRKYSQKAIANSEGIATMKVDGGQYSLVAWESAKYPGKYAQNVYLIEKGQGPIKISGIYFAP